MIHDPLDSSATPIEYDYKQTVVLGDDFYHLLQQFAMQNQQAIVDHWADDRAKEIRYLADLPITQHLQLEDMAQVFRYRR